MLITATIDETLIYYDRPLLFTCFDSDGQKHLVVLSEEKDDGSEIWLAAPIADDILAAVKAGECDFRLGFAGCPQVAVRVGKDGSAAEAQLSIVPEEWLPDVGVRL